jgi:hypothetical protein
MCVDAAGPFGPAFTNGMPNGPARTIRMRHDLLRTDGASLPAVKVSH